MAQQAVVYHHGPNVVLLPWLKPSWLPKVVVPAPDFLGPDAPPCLLWLGGKSMDGYGLLRMQDGKMKYLHRRAWEEHNGRLLGTNDGHHICYVRNCFQPVHIDAASMDDNRGPTQFKAKCPVDDAELVALYDLYRYEMQNGGYVLSMENAPVMG